MQNKILKAAYSPADFKKRGAKLIDELTHHINKINEVNSGKTLHWIEPNASMSFWEEFLINGDSDELFQEVLLRSTHVMNPKCIGHQVVPAAPITLLTSMLSAILNNGTAVYEMGMVTNPMERIITELLGAKIGYDGNSNGFLTSGGTLANLTALLSARKAKASNDVWNEGQTKPLGIMVSEEAHYCVERAAKIMGLGENGLVKIPVKANFSMDTSLLENYYKNAIQNGIEVFAIVGSAPSTATGILDNLEEIGLFAQKYNLWYHVDAAHGGSALFSNKYRYTLNGISKSDSVVIDGHKMMMMPGITTALIYKDGRASNATFQQKADYLLEDSLDSDWYNSGKRTFECTKNMMALHWFSLLKIYGEELFDEFVTTRYDLGTAFGQMIENEKNLELSITPMTNIVCFRYINDDLNLADLNELNTQIRQGLLEDGEFYIVQTKLRGIHYLRCTIMNPFTTEIHLRQLLTKVKSLAEKITK
ncbi:MAG: aspartate aminotransferase family protein [Maribacter sp.]